MQTEPEPPLAELPADYDPEHYIFWPLVELPESAAIRPPWATETEWIENTCYHRLALTAPGDRWTVGIEQDDRFDFYGNHTPGIPYVSTEWGPDYGELISEADPDELAELAGLLAAAATLLARIRAAG